MTLKQLEQYNDMRREAKLWERELQALQRKAGGAVKDTVRGSSADYPYTEHPVTISGVQTKPNQRILRRKRRLEARKTALETQLEEIDEFIDSLQDSQLRQIVQYHYIDDYSWKKSAICAGISEGAAKMMVRRYFGKA